MDRNRTTSSQTSTPTAPPRIPNGNNPPYTPKSAVSPVASKKRNSSSHSPPVSQELSSQTSQTSLQENKSQSYPPVSNPSKTGATMNLTDYPQMENKGAESRNKQFENPKVILGICLAVLFILAVTFWVMRILIQRRVKKQELEKRKKWVPPRPNMRDSLIDSDVGVCPKITYRNRLKSWGSLSDMGQSGILQLKGEGSHVGSTAQSARIWSNDFFSSTEEKLITAQDEISPPSRVRRSGTSKSGLFSNQENLRFEPIVDGYNDYNTHVSRSMSQKYDTRNNPNFHSRIQNSVMVPSRVAESEMIFPSDSISRVGQG
ncbi:hypothetical protein O181_011094 [Austropuccinia psidii MF-1]|uniref:Uncharacterized protein n=1 Tax=Austropuccinia psidii MF-1 TaxID=1389203 RepID=A0A9Q3BTV3_9BASI|nr:hypothetical protein [Austropuccinia psidii MF-1]